MLYMLYIWVCNKVKLFLTELIMEPFHEDIWSSGGRAPSILFIGTRWVERSASRPGCFSLGQETPVSIWCEGGWTPQPVFTLWNTENVLACREPNPDSSVVQPRSLCVCLVRGYNCVYIWVMQVPCIISEHRRCRGMTRQMGAFQAIKLPCSVIR
jgi:hypothetical protein